MPLDSSPEVESESESESSKNRTKSESGESGLGLGAIPIADHFNGIWAKAIERVTGQFDNQRNCQFEIIAGAEISPKFINSFAALNLRHSSL